MTEAQIVQYVLCLAAVAAAAWCALSSDDARAGRGLIVAAAAVGLLGITVGWWLLGAIWLTYVGALIRRGRPAQTPQKSSTRCSSAAAAIVSAAGFIGGALLISGRAIAPVPSQAHASIGRPELAGALIVLAKRYGLGACAIGLTVLSVVQAMRTRETVEP